MIGISFPSGCHRAWSSVRPTVDQATSSRWVCRNRSSSSRSSRRRLRVGRLIEGHARESTAARCDRRAGRLARVQRVIVVGPSGSGKTTRRGGARAPHRTARTPSSTRCGGIRAGPRSAPRSSGAGSRRWSRPTGGSCAATTSRVGMRELAWPRADTIVLLDLAQVAHDRPDRPPHGPPVAAPDRAVGGYRQPGDAPDGPRARRAAALRVACVSEVPRALLGDPRGSASSRTSR